MSGALGQGEMHTLARAKGAPGVPVTVTGLLGLPRIELELRPLTIIMGGPRSGKKSLLRSLYLYTWISQSADAGWLVETLFPGLEKGFTVTAGSGRVEYRGRGKVYVEGEPAWRHAVLLPYTFLDLVRLLDNMAEFIESRDVDRRTLIGLGAILGILARTPVFTVFRRAFMLCNDIASLAPDTRSMSLGHHMVTRYQLLAFRRIIGKPPTCKSLSACPEDEVAYHVLERIIDVLPRKSILLLEDPPFLVFGVKAPTDALRERLLNDGVWVVMTLTLPRHLIKCHSHELDRVAENYLMTIGFTRADLEALKPAIYFVERSGDRLVYRLIS